MTYEEKKAWLWRYRDADKLFRQLTCRLEEARTAARHMTQNFSPTPSGSGDGQSLARAVEREDDLERQVSFQLAERNALFEEIDEALQQLPDYRDYTIMKKYYLDGLTWTRIAKDMNYSLRMIFILRRKALEQLQL